MKYIEIRKHRCRDCGCVIKKRSIYAKFCTTCIKVRKMRFKHCNLRLSDSEWEMLCRVNPSIVEEIERKSEKQKLYNSRYKKGYDPGGGE